MEAINPVNLAQLHTELVNKEHLHAAVVLYKGNWSEDKSIFICVDENGGWLGDFVEDKFVPLECEDLQKALETHIPFREEFNIEIIAKYQHAKEVNDAVEMQKQRDKLLNLEPREHVPIINTSTNGG